MSLSSARASRSKREYGAVNPAELLHAMRRKDRAMGPGDRVESGYRLNEALTARRAGALLKGAANAALNATRLGDVIKLVATRDG